MIRTSIRSMIAVAALVGAAPLSAQQPIDQTVASAPTGSVSISNTAGEVRVMGWDRNEVQVRGELGRGAERVDVGGDRENIQIRVVIPRNARNVRGTDLIVRVPLGKQVRVHTTSADIAVDGIRGPIQLQSTSGDVDVSGDPATVEGRSTSGDVIVRVGTTGHVQATTTSGDIEVSGTIRESVNIQSVSGDVELSGSVPEVRAKSVSGDIDVRGVSGRVSLNTVSGNASIHDSRIQFGAFESVSGDLRYQGEIPPRAAFNIASHSGNVVFAIPASSAAEFNVTSFSGSINNQLGPEAERTSRYGPGRELRFTLGSGGSVVSIKTFSGNVRIARQ